jgi:sulfate transport system ATP-binding protein
MLLLDEPFGALDAKVRQELRTWLRRLHEEMHVTTVFVTHDQEEAFEVADQVVVLRGGQIEQVGTPTEVFDHPATPFVMDFLGNVNVFQGRLENGEMHLGPFRVEYPQYTHSEARQATGYVRPHELELAREPVSTRSRSVRVIQLNPAGSVVKVRVHSVDLGIELTVDVVREQAEQLGLRLGDEVFVSPRNVRVFLPSDFTI